MPIIPHKVKLNVKGFFKKSVLGEMIQSINHADSNSVALSPSMWEDICIYIARCLEEFNF